MIITMQIGKKGLTEEQVAEITRQLNGKKTVRIKILESAAEEKERIVEELKARTKAQIIKKIGNTITIKKNI